jgi:hypothetical protein
MTGGSALMVTHSTRPSCAHRGPWGLDRNDSPAALQCVRRTQPPDWWCRTARS